MVALYKQYLEALGHEVTIFTLGDPDPEGDDPGVIRSPALPVGEGYYVSVRYSREAQALLGQMDIIHCHHLFMSVEMAHRYGRCPIVYTNHTRYDLYTGSYIPIPQPAADAVMRQIWPDFSDFADVVITPSESVRKVMLDFGVRRPITVIENGVDFRLFSNPPAPLSKKELGIPESAVLLAYVGRLAPEKNLDVLLREFHLALEIVPSLQLLLIGKGPMVAELKGECRRLDLEKSVHFLGPVGYEQVGNYLAAADFFVTASVTEVHPLTIIEAMAAGLPVVAVKSPGILDTVESGQSGYLTTYPQGGLAAGIVGMAVDDLRRQKMGRIAQRSCQRFDINRTVAKTVALYERLRSERPDLMRKRKHGRWLSSWERLEPLVQQLDKLLNTAEQIGTGPLRKIIADPLADPKDND